ncbi:MAG: PEP-CTERM system histidine kinase PrsK [Pseudomonadales bacterium]|nr:PEP-CTERM system histidine kinase PrsK [Pseudomonadales bacterium]
MQAIAAYGLLLAIGVYATFLVFCLVNLVRRVSGKALLLCSIMSLVWVITLLTPARSVLGLPLEIATLCSWQILLFRAIGFEFDNKSEQGRLVRQIAYVTFFTASATVVAWLAFAFELNQFVGMLVPVGMLIINICGLVLIEQLARNIVQVNIWRVRYLNIGLGILFTYGLLVWAVRLGLGDLANILQVAQPAVFAITMPFIAIASLRNRTNHLRFNLSREFVFRSGVLAASGAFLVALSVIAYLSQLFAGDVGLTIATFATVLLIGITLAIVGSSRFRSVSRVLFTKTFFESRYDHRAEWTRLTSRLANTDPDHTFNEQLQLSFLSVLSAKTASLWILKGAEFERTSSMGEAPWPPAMPQRLSDELISFYESHDWVLDASSGASEAATVFSLVEDESLPVRFVIPLLVDEKLIGVCFVGESEAITRHLDWEDYDAIKLIARQCASFLAFNEAQRSLIEHEQFAAVAQMSAFLVHDIKTISSQLSLLLENAEKHKSNPAFIDDMLSTTQNSVKRMQKIIRSLTVSEDTVEFVPAITGIHDWLKQIPDLKNRVRFNSQSFDEEPSIPLEFISAINHLVQNALESSQSATVELSVQTGRGVVYISVNDTGPGMTENFVREELFKPFSSSKGVSGMGIGAFQAKTIVEKHGGKLDVRSSVGAGTQFKITYSTKESVSVG